MRAGMAFADPPELPVRSGAPALLTARPTRFRLAGRPVWGEAYNGSFVGPTLRFEPGQRVRIALRNALSVATNLHFHGLQVSPSGASDNPFLTVGPGRTFTYRLDIPRDHPQGTFWYHDHQMAGRADGAAMATMAGMSGMAADRIRSTPTASRSTVAGSGALVPGRPAGDLPPAQTTGLSTSDLENQTIAGLAGTIVVGDDRRLLPPALRHVAEHILALKDVQIDGQGRIVQNTGSAAINSNNPTVRLVNGLLRPVLTVRPGETQLWRLANEGADIFYRLRLDATRFTVIGQDGEPAPRPYAASTLLMPPGKRYDVLVTAPIRAGAGWLRTLPYSNGPQGDAYPEAQLVRLRVAGRLAAPARAPIGALPSAAASLATAPVARRRTVELSEDPSGTKLFINATQFSMARSIFTTPGTVDTVEEWTILNTSGEVHPFHIHTHHFQVMSVDGVPQPYHGLQDTVPVPSRRRGRPGTVVIRIRLARYPGRWMFHCHIAAHEDNGMMSYLNVVAPARR